MSDITIVIGAIGLVAGSLIGCVGVGGVIVVPALVYDVGAPIHDAIAAAMMGYILTGLIGTSIYARSRSIRWDLAGWIALGAGPGALLGAWAINFIAPIVLECGIGALALLSGLNALWNRWPDRGAGTPALGASTLLPIGFATGALSAVTGTGGPLVLVPILLWLGLPTLTAVGLSQAAQVPIATLATLGNFLNGAPDVSSGVALGAGLAIGTWAGARAAHAMPRRALDGLAAAVLVTVGTLILVRLGFRPFA